MFANEWSVKSGGMWQALQFATVPVKMLRPFCCAAVSAAVFPAWNRSHGVWSGIERALVGRDRHSDARRGHGGVAERGGEEAAA